MPWLVLAGMCGQVLLRFDDDSLAIRPASDMWMLLEDLVVPPPGLTYSAPWRIKQSSEYPSDKPAQTNLSKQLDILSHFSTEFCTRTQGALPKEVRLTLM